MVFVAQLIKIIWPNTPRQIRLRVRGSSIQNMFR